MKTGFALMVCGVICGMPSDVFGGFPQACLQYPLYDDGVIALYVADYYEEDNSADPCEQVPTAVYYWIDSALASAPQMCPFCEDVYVNASERDKNRDAFVTFKPKLREVLPREHLFHDTLRPIPAKKGVGTPTQDTWDPRPGIKVVSSQWAVVETVNGRIPAKLYVVEFDLSRVALPDDAHPFQRKIPQHRIGFEMKSLPDGMVLPALKANRWNQNPECPTACTVKVDNEQEPYFVITNTDVFLDGGAR